MEKLKAMKSAFTLIIVLFFSCVGWGQTDIPKRQPLKLSAEKKLEVKSTPNKGTALNMPSILTKNPDAKLNDPLKDRNIKMLPDKQLKQAGFDMKIDPKVGEAERKGSGKFFGDMYLGDIKTSSKFIGVVCRDHEYVDGDRVKVYANDQVVEPNIMLTGSFKGINIDLDKGFNRLDFEALNQGTSGPNTAQVDVYDENGKLLYSNKWLLSTGSKASLIVVQE